MQASSAQGTPPESQRLPGNSSARTRGGDVERADAGPRDHRLERLDCFGAFRGLDVSRGFRVLGFGGLWEF